MRLGRRGSVALEFALVGTILVVMLTTTCDLGRYEITQQSLRIVASESARYALTTIGMNTTPACSYMPSPSALQTRITTLNSTPMLTASMITVTSAPCAAADANGVHKVSVTLSYPFTFITWVLWPNAGVVTASVDTVF